MIGGLRDEARGSDPIAAQGGVAQTETADPSSTLSEEQTLITAQPPSVDAGPEGGPIAPPHSDSPDPVALAAVEPARAAAVEVAGAAVGEHLGGEAEPGQPGEAVVTHRFASTSPAYVGWHWAVTVVRAAGSDTVGVNEVVLLPGAGALVAPAWVPWSDRVVQGDLSAGDLLPPSHDDERLSPAYAESDSELADEVYWQLGLGRPRVLSRVGRTDAAQRWWEGDAGPLAPIARSAPGNCADCGFLLPMSGAMSMAFGVCANGLAPDDGRVVALAHGCGAHSETEVQLQHTTEGMPAQDEEFDLQSGLSTAPSEEAAAPPYDDSAEAT